MEGSNPSKGSPTKRLREHVDLKEVVVELNVDELRVIVKDVIQASVRESLKKRVFRIEEEDERDDMYEKDGSAKDK